MKKLYVTQDRVLIQLLKASLDQKGIPCLIKNEDYAGQAGGRLPPVIAWPEIWVMEDKDYDEAMSLVQQELNHQGSQMSTSWKCAKCGEESGEQFGICWKCGSSR